MKPEDKVCTPEQAEKLLNLTFTALETEHYWFIGDLNRTKEPVLLHRSNVDDELKIGHSFDCWLFPAPDIAELGILLPYNDISIWKEGEVFNADIEVFDSDSNLIDHTQLEGFRTEAQIRAEVAIWLISNRYLLENDLKL